MSGAIAVSISPSRSASVDSGNPVVRTTRERTTARARAAASRGITSCRSRFRISYGTPGSMMTSPGGPSSQMPGAVPHRLGSTVAPRGISACTRLLSAGTRPSLANRATTACQTLSSNSSGTPNRRATARLEMSSRVGPSPPVVSTVPVRASAPATASAMSSARSATDVRRTTCEPLLAEGPGDLRPVGVEGEAEEELGADGEEFEGGSMQ